MTSRPHVVLGAGQVGTEIARQLAAAGEHVSIATRAGRDPGIAGVTPVRMDAADAASVRAATAGAAVAYFAVQPAYTKWPTDFPPLVDGVLGGLAGSGTRLVVVDNLYMYGPTGGAPIREDLPYAATNRKGTARAKMATRLLAADRAGDVRVAIGRGSDFFGPGATDTVVGDRFFGRIVAGKPAEVYGRPDLPHSFTYVPDFARALIELGRHEDACGRAWHVPTAPAGDDARVRDGRGSCRGQAPQDPHGREDDAPARRAVHPRGPRGDRDGVRVRGAVPPRRLGDPRGVRADAHAVRGVDPRHRGVVRVGGRAVGRPGRLRTRLHAGPPGPVRPSHAGSEPGPLAG